MVHDKALQSEFTASHFLGPSTYTISVSVYVRASSFKTEILGTTYILPFNKRFVPIDLGFKEQAGFEYISFSRFF